MTIHILHILLLLYGFNSIDSKHHHGNKNVTLETIIKNGIFNKKYQFDTNNTQEFIYIYNSTEV